VPLERQATFVTAVVAEAVVGVGAEVAVVDVVAGGVQVDEEVAVGEIRVGKAKAGR